MSIEGFVNKKFNIVFQSPGVSSVEKAEIIMLPEIHNDQLQKMNNAKLIDLFVHNTKVILVEGVPSMREVDQKSDAQALFVKSKVRVLGWDRDTTPKMMGFSEELTAEYSAVKAKQAAWYRKSYELMRELKAESFPEHNA